MLFFAKYEHDIEKDDDATKKREKNETMMLFEFPNHCCIQLAHAKLFLEHKNVVYQRVTY